MDTRGSHLLLATDLMGSKKAMPNLAPQFPFSERTLSWVIWTDSDASRMMVNFVQPTFVRKPGEQTTFNLHIAVVARSVLQELFRNSSTLQVLKNFRAGK